MQRYRKRAYSVLLVLSLLALTVQAATTHAQTAFQGYTTGVRVANVSTSNSASVTLTAYDPNGAAVWSFSDTNNPIPSNQSRTYFPITDNATLKGAFVGSMVATASSGNIVSIANLTSYSGEAGASFIGQAVGASTVRLPLLMKNNGGFYTWFSVQNADPQFLTTANVTVQYSDGTNASATIPPGTAQNFFQVVENHSQAVFAATIISNVAIAVAVVQESASMMLAYTGFRGSGSITPVFPLINTNNGGIVTGIQLQNNGSSATAVTITYQPSTSGTACTEAQTIQPGASNSFALAAFSTSANPPGVTSTCIKGAMFIGSAKVTVNSGNQPLTGVVNQVKSSANQAGAYGGFDANAVTNKVVFPLIMDRNSGYFTGFNVQNVGTTNSTVTCTFANSNRTLNVTLAPGQSLTDLQANQLADKYVGSALCQDTTNTGAKLVGVVNELGPSTTQDQLLVYEGINP